MRPALFKWGSWVRYCPSPWRQTRKTPVGDTNCNGAGMLQKTKHCQEFPCFGTGSRSALSSSSSSAGALLDRWYISTVLVSDNPAMVKLLSVLSVMAASFLLQWPQHVCVRLCLSKVLNMNAKSVISFSFDKSQFLLLFLLQWCPFVQNGTNKRICLSHLIVYWHICTSQCMNHVMCGPCWVHI